MNSNKTAYFDFASRKDRTNFCTLMVNDIQLQLIDMISRQLKNYDPDYQIVDYKTIRAYWYKLLTNTPRMRKDISLYLNKKLLKQGWTYNYQFSDLCERLNIGGTAPDDCILYAANPFTMKVGSSVFIDPSIINQIDNIIKYDTLNNFELSNTAYACINNHVRNRFIVISINFKITNQNHHTTLTMSMDEANNSFDPINDDEQLPYQNDGNIRYADSFMASLKRAKSLPTIFIGLQQAFAKPQQAEIKLRSLKLLSYKPKSSKLKKQHELSLLTPQITAVDFNANAAVPQASISIPQNINIKLTQIATNLISAAITSRMLSSTVFFTIHKVHVDSTLNYIDDFNFNVRVKFSLDITTDKIDNPKRYNYETRLCLALNTNGIINCSLGRRLAISNGDIVKNDDCVINNRILHIFTNHATAQAVSAKSNQIFMFIKSAVASISDPLRLINHQPTYNNYPKASLSDPDFRALLKSKQIAYRFVTSHLRFDQTQAITKLLQTAITHQLAEQRLSFEISSCKDLKYYVSQYDPETLSTKFVEFNSDWQKEFNINSNNVPTLDDNYLNFQPIYSTESVTPLLILLQPAAFINTRAKTISGICRMMLNNKSSNDFAVVTYMYMIHITDNEKGHEALQIDLQAAPFKNCNDNYGVLINKFGVTCKSFDDSALKLNHQLAQLLTVNYQNDNDKQYIQRVKDLLNK